MILRRHTLAPRAIGAALLLLAPAMFAPGPARAAIQANSFPTSAGSSVLVCSGRPWVDVLCYGADPAGIADSTSAFTTLFGDAVANGVPMHIPAGTYKITTALTLDLSGLAAASFRIISDNAVLNGVAVAGAPVLTIIRSGGTPGSPVTTAGFAIDGALTVKASSAAYACQLGKSDLSDILASPRINRLACDNASVSGSAGGIRINYVTGGGDGTGGAELVLSGTTAGGSASVGGVAVNKLVNARLSGGGKALGASAPSLLIDGASTNNQVAGFDYGASPAGLSITGTAAANNLFVAPNFAGNANPVNAPQAQQGNVIVAPTGLAGPLTGGIQVIGRGGLSRYSAPVAASYTAAGADDGLILSAANGTGAAYGFEAASLAVTLPTPANVGAGWTMGFAAAAGKAVVLTPPGGVSILAGNSALASLAMGGRAHEFAMLVSDGANFRLAYASERTAAASGAANFLPSHYIFPGGPGYQATQDDNGTVISSGATSGGLAVTLPSTTAVKPGWTVRLVRDASRNISVQVNGVAGGQIVSPGGSVASLAVAPVDYSLVDLQFDGSVFRVTSGVPADTLSPLQFGAKCDNATDDSAAFALWFTAVRTTGKPGALPEGTCKIDGQVYWDLTAAAATGVTIRGAGVQRSILRLTTTSGPAFKIGGSTDLFYGKFTDFAVKCNLAATCLQLGNFTGPSTYPDALNVFTLDLWVGNDSANAAAVAVEVNHYLNSPYTNLVANTGGAGTALKLRQALFNNFFGSYSTGSKGIHYVDGYAYGNVFHAVDIENILGGAAGGPVVSDIVTASKQTFIGGTFVWTNSSADGGGVRINDGSNNFRFIGTQFSRSDAGSIYPIAIGAKAAVVQIDTDIEGTFNFAALNVAPRAADAELALLIPDGFTGGITLKRKDDAANPPRWRITSNGAGTALNITRFNAGGTAVDNPLSLDWSSGVATFATDVRIVNPANAAIATFSNEANGSYQINLPSVGGTPRTMALLEQFPVSTIIGWNGSALTAPSPPATLRVNANQIQFGKTDYPSSGYGFLDGPNTYLFGDAGDTSSDVSMVARTTGNARWEWGMVGAVTDSVVNQSWRIKSVTGTYPSETFTDRFVVSDSVNPRYPAVDVYPAPGQSSLLRVYGTGAGQLPCIVIGNANCKASPTGTGAGLELTFDPGSSIARLTAIEHDLYYRDVVYEANNHRWSTGPVFLNVDAMRLNSQGALLLGAPVQKAVSAVVSNTGAAGLALMSGYVPGVDVLTALGGTGTAPTFTGTNTQVSRVNSIAAAGTGGTPGAVVLTGTTGTGTKFQINGTIGAGGNLTATGTFVLRGNYTGNPAILTAEPVTGGGLAGTSLNISMGALTLAMTTPGALTVTPNTPVATSSSAAGTGATLDITYQCGVGCLNALEVRDNGIAPQGVAGTGYVRAGYPTLSSVNLDNTAGAQAIQTFADGGINKFAFAKQTDNTFIGYDYANAANFLRVSTGGALTLGESTGGGVFLAGLGTTPGGKQPVCIDTGTGLLYKGNAGAC